MERLSMIICHPLRLIFIKTKKVGGTSFEIALSRYCGPDCVITKISDDDEVIRKNLGFRGPQNNREKNRNGLGIDGQLNEFVQGDFDNHDNAEKVHRQIGDDNFGKYQKISIHRNPLDFLISQYFFRIRKNDAADVPFRKWYFENRENALENGQIAPRSGPHSCNVVLQYETLAEQISSLHQLPDTFLETFCSINAKANFRDKLSRDARKFFIDHGLEGEIKDLLALVG